MFKTSEIKAYKNNPRNNDDAVGPVAESIKQFGFKVPIIIDKNNVIVAGHTRLKAAIKLKLAEVPCIVADDLTEEQIKAFRLADNKVSEFATWDIDLLDLELGSIRDIDMKDFSFELSLDKPIDNSDSFDHISALLSDTGMPTKTNEVQRYFDVTLSFQVQDKPMIENYMNDVGGRRGLEKMILEEARKCLE